LEKQLFLVALFRENIVGFDSLENGGSIDFLFVHKDYLIKKTANKNFIKLKLMENKLGSKN
jgi:hypothetical protein